MSQRTRLVFNANRRAPRASVDMPRLLLAAVVLAILAVCASAQTRAAFSPVGSPGRLAPGTLQTSLDDYAEDDGFAFDPGTFWPVTTTRQRRRRWWWRKRPSSWM